MPHGWAILDRQLCGADKRALIRPHDPSLNKLDPKDADLPDSLTSTRKENSRHLPRGQDLATRLDPRRTTTLDK